MCRKIAICLIIFLANISARATWSIIYVDPVTHEIGIAGASCSNNCFGIGRIIPNMGAVIVQAMSNGEAREKGIQLLMANATPEEIIRSMRAPRYDPENQQYAVVSVKYMQDVQTYTGTSTTLFHGALTDDGISVQGNTLANENELKIVLNAVRQGKKDLKNIADILMTALEEGGKAGGDKRCGEQRATSAFITIAKPSDKEPYVTLIVSGQKQGGDNAVELLRIKYDNWKKKHEK